MAFRLRLHHRIVIPVAVVAVGAILASSLIALTVVSREFESRTRSQLANTADVIARGGFAFNPTILRSVKMITGADVITFDTSGALVSTTVDPSQTTLIAAVTTGQDARDAQTAGPAGIVRDLSCGEPCIVAYRPAMGRPGTLIAVVFQTSATTAANRAVSRTILLAALASLAALVLISQLVARRVTAPIAALVRFSQEVGAGSSARAAVGDDEVGRLGRAFNQMLDRLDESKVAKVRNEKLALAGFFAARVAHDIRNPLASMKINAQLVESAVGGDERNQAAISAVLHDISTVEAVIRDLIELARPGELRLVPADINALIRTVMRQLDARLTHRKVTAVLNLPDRLPLVKIDTQRFSQVLNNVVINAVDAMINGGVLTVTTHVEGAELIIDVDDDGVGLDPAIADRIFDPFVSSKPEGVGLGLVNAKAVVEGHGGRIQLTPRQPRGTRARIALPV